MDLEEEYKKEAGESPTDTIEVDDGCRVNTWEVYTDEYVWWLDDKIVELSKSKLNSDNIAYLTSLKKDMEGDGYYTDANLIQDILEKQK